MNSIFVNYDGKHGREYVPKDELDEYLQRAKAIEQAAREFIEHLLYPYDNIARSSKQLEKLRSALGMD